MLRERLRMILGREEDLVPELEKVVEELVERYRPISIIVTGSLARQKFVRGMSDIDLLVVVEKSVGKDRFKEIREFIEQRIRYYRRLKVLNEIDKILEELPPTPSGLGPRIVREERDSG